MKKSARLILFCILCLCNKESKFMNIYPVNFCGKKGIQNIKPAKNKEQQTKPKSHINLKPFIAGGAAALLLTGAVSTLPVKGKPVSIPFDSHNMSISEIAQTYNTKEDAILAYNNISENNPIENLSELKMPDNYDYLQNEIQKLQNRLHSYAITPGERITSEKQINALKKKQQEQQYVATTYTDGKNLFIHINIDEKAPENIKEKYEFGINIETLKKLFDIKDGAVEDNNDINAIWIDNDDTGKTGYFDYTRNWFHNGETIIVPVSSIKTEKIDLSGYIK